MRSLLQDTLDTTRHARTVINREVILWEMAAIYAKLGMPHTVPSRPSSSKQPKKSSAAAAKDSNATTPLSSAYKCVRPLPLPPIHKASL